MSDSTLGEALPREIARIQNEVMPAYIEIGAAGMFALTMMRASVAAANKAMIEGDCVAMIAAYQDLKEYKL